MNKLKKRILGGQFVTAAWADFGSPDTAEAMVLAGWDTIIIDGEHGSGDLEQWIAMARAIESAGGEAILRVSHGQTWLLNRVLDRGIRSILVPRINTAAEAQAIADACRYPPRGIRGYAAPLTRAAGYGTRPGYGLAEAHEELFLMVQCEHVEAVENISELAAVEGVDAIFIGPNDLAGSIDRIEQLEDPAVLELIARVEAECRDQGKPLATITGPGRDFPELKALGYCLAVGTNDVSCLMAAARGAAEARDAALGIVAKTVARTAY